MQIIFTLIFISLAVATLFLGAYFWAIRTGQFEDDITPAMRILLDDKPADEKPKEKKSY